MFKFPTLSLSSTGKMAFDTVLLTAIHDKTAKGAEQDQTAHYMQSDLALYSSQNKCKVLNSGIWVKIHSIDDHQSLGCYG